MFAGAGIGIARVDNQGAHAVFVEKVRFGDADGGGAEAVACKHCPDSAAGGYVDQRQVGMLGFFDAGLGGIKGDAVDAVELFGGFFGQFDSHNGSPCVVRCSDGIVCLCRLKRFQNSKRGIINGAMSAVNTPLRVKPNPAYAAIRRLRSSEAAMPIACEAVPSDIPTDEGITTVFFNIL